MILNAMKKPGNKFKKQTVRPRENSYKKNSRLFTIAAFHKYNKVIIFHKKNFKLLLKMTDIFMILLSFFQFIVITKLRSKTFFILLKLLGSNIASKIFWCSNDVLNIDFWSVVL